MAKAASTYVFPIIFLVVFALVEQNMGCTTSIGPCEVGKNCSPKCNAMFGEIVTGFCDRSGGGIGICVCVTPCPPPPPKAPHM
ncbi:unnamed protein product [Arabis nemorensis]|uniref:Defensin-like protein n=1 Tax=Arabis nemorensis TaxID=586526 RepID=A0A565C2T3_9BRAS|nr:unnamed protein product [Arabis nemorensis]